MHAVFCEIEQNFYKSRIEQSNFEIGLKSKALWKQIFRKYNLNDIITAGGVRIEGMRSNRLQIVTSSLNQLIIRKGNGMDDLFLNVYLLLNPHTVDFSNHIGVCGTLSLDIMHRSPSSKYEILFVIDFRA